MTGRAHQAFTIIEILIVVTIIAVLVGLLMVAANTVRFRAGVLRTIQRMEGIQAQLTRVGQQQGSAAYGLQARCGVGGVLTFKADETNAVVANRLLPIPIAGSWADATQKHNFAFPWNQEDRIGTINASTGTGTSADPDSLAVQDPATGLYRFVSTAVLQELEPIKTEALLAGCGILIDDPATPVDEAQALYRNDRSSDVAWNDAWGNPLVVAYGLFQPVTPQGVADALVRYQYSRAVYASVASAGPEIRASYALGSDWAANVRNVWRQANEVCQTTPAARWDYQAFERAPWQGVKVGENVYPGEGTYRSLLSAPLEFK
ncbi:MAG: type II secretion system protein [Planctomycetes bacterium]|nr:type II secretion system protein [Planctomycetota bacterium]